MAEKAFQKQKMTEEMQAAERGVQSEEKNAQEEREKNTLSALYIAGQIPDTPGEPATQIPADEVDKEVKPMLAGGEIQPFFTNASIELNP